MGWAKRMPPLPFALLAFWAAAGVVAADRWPIGWMVPAGVLAMCSGLFFWKGSPPLFCTAVAAGFFCLHTFNHHGDPSKRLAGELSSHPRVVFAEGRVDSEPRVFQNARGDTFCGFVARLTHIRIDHAVDDCRARVNVSWPGPAPEYGDHVVFAGEATNLTPVRNPGEYDLTDHLQRNGIYSEIRVRYESDIRITRGNHGNPLLLAGLQTRRWMERALTTGIEDAPLVAGLVKSMVLGMKGETPPEIRDLFRRTGTIHVFVVSGLHVGMVALIVWQLLRVLGLGRRTTAALAVPFLVFYALLTGGSPGSVRATIMATIVLFGIALERPAITLNSLAAAFVITLLWDTDQLFMPGFQFSFAVVLAIILIAGRLNDRFRKLGAPDPFLPRTLWTPWQRGRTAALQYAIGLAAVSTAAWIGSLAFTAGYFHLLSPMALIANVFVVPLAFIILSQGVLSILSYTFSAGAAAIFNNCNWLAVHALVGTVRFFATLPGGHAYVELPEPGPTPDLEMTVLDLNSGGCIHVRTEGSDWLIDCGNTRTYRSIVRPYLQSRGVNRLDGLILTHGDASHIGAATDLLLDFHPKRVILPTLSGRSPALKKLRDPANVSPSIHKRGDRLRLNANADIRVLFPPAGLERRHSDDEAMILQITAGESRFLLVGDSGFYSEQWLLKHEDALTSDFLIAGRNRLDLSLTPDFLRAVRPEVLVLGRSHYADNRTHDFVWQGTLIDQAESGAVHIRISDGAAIIHSHLGDKVWSLPRK